MGSRSGWQPPRCGRARPGIDSGASVGGPTGGTMALDSIGNRLHTVRTLLGAGIVTPVRPDKLLRLGAVLWRFGPTPAAGYTAASIRYPGEPVYIVAFCTLTI